MEGVPCRSKEVRHMANRQVEVFTAGCPVCEPAVQLVQELACPDCEVTIHDLRHPDRTAPEKAAEYGINVVPAVVVDGTLVSCCETPGPTREALSAAGIGQRL
jgi:glutaredoxin